MSRMTECNAVGTIAYEHPPTKTSQFIRLANILRVMSYSSCRVRMHEVVLRMPKQSGSAHSTLHLSTSLLVPSRATHALLQEPAPARWEVSDAGHPLTDPKFAREPMILKEITTSESYGNHVPSFWMSLGGELDYELVRDGNEYMIMTGEGIEVQVHMVSISRFLNQEEGANAPLNCPSVQLSNGAQKKIWVMDPKNFLVELTCRVPIEGHADGIKAIKTVAKSIREFVTVGRSK
jgi:hypothetical protein